MYTEAFPIISSPDLRRTLAFYQAALDAQVTYQFPPEGQPVYVSMTVGGCHVGLGHAPDRPTGPDHQRFSLWIYTDACDVARLRELGATVTEEPVDQPWGERVAKVLDPDGNELIIGQKG